MEQHANFLLKGMAPVNNDGPFDARLRFNVDVFGRCTLLALYSFGFLGSIHEINHAQLVKVFN